MSKNVLITGATGEQGGNVINALLSNSALPPGSTILAVTRNASSKNALQLAKKSLSIKVIEGELDEVPLMFDTASAAVEGNHIWGVFSVQTFMGKGASVETEERQGKALIDESIKRGVHHFVYTSVERGGNVRSWENPTTVPHFISKHNIERHLRTATESGKASNMTWTILRPVTFFENIQPGFFAKLFHTTWLYAVGSKPLQMVSTRDIGWFGAHALLFPELYRNKAIGLAGDEVTFAQLNSAFQKVTGRSAPMTLNVFAWVFMWALPDLGAMFRWFAAEGAKADLKEVRSLHPDILDLETYLSTCSGFAHDLSRSSKK